MIRIFLNGSLCTDSPKGLDDLAEELTLNYDLHGYLYQIKGSITFIGSDYETIRALYESDYCQDLDLDIQISEDFGASYRSVAKGIIKLAGVKWNQLERMAECPITDNSFLSKINNNSEIEFQLGRTGGNLLSKNGVDVQYKFVAHDNVQMFSPFRGRYFIAEANFNKTDPPFAASEGDDLVDIRPYGRNGIFIYDALNMLIAMMTDDEVDFESDFFTYDLASPSTYREIAFAVIMSGLQLRNGTGYPTISFRDFFDDLHKLCNIYFSLEVSSAGKPVIRVEREDYFRSINSDVYFDSVKGLVEYIDLSKIYSKVVVGCSRDGSNNFPVGEVPLVHHVQEEFPLSGNCNTQNELDLRLRRLIINTNTISKSLPPVSGYNGSSTKRKYTTEQTQAGGPSNQQITDTSGTFQESLIGSGFLIRNVLSDEYSYVSSVIDNDNIYSFDEIFIVDNTGLVKNYEIFTPSDDSSLDEDVFLIQCDRSSSSAGTAYAFQTLIDPPSELYYYNDVYANWRVIERHLGNVCQSVVNNFSDGNDEFLSELTVGQVLDNTTYFKVVANDQYRRIRFNDDSSAPNFDTNGNYDAATGEYTAIQDGYYHAYCSVRVNNSSGASGFSYDFTQQVELVQVSVSGNIIASESAAVTILDLTSYTFVLDRTFYMSEGDTLGVYVKKPFGLNGLWLNQYVPFSEFDVLGIAYGVVGTTGLSFFGVDALYNGGGLVPTNECEEGRLLVGESTLSVDRDVFDSVMQYPFRYYHTNDGSVNYFSGFIESISRGLLSGETAMKQFRKKGGV